MIDDSIPWREDLERTAARLRRRLTQLRWQERTFFLIEKDLMIGFYSIRRLMESHKTSTLLGSKRIPVIICPLVGKEPGAYDRWSPWEFFDLDSDRKSEIDLRSLTNEFIHSFILKFSFNENRDFLGVFIGSDRTKRTHIFEVSIIEIIDLFDYVACEDVVLVSSLSNWPTVRLSQHDLVEIGAAKYIDASQTWHELDDDFKVEGFAKLPGLTADQLSLLEGIWRR